MPIMSIDLNSIIYVTWDDAAGSLEVSAQLTWHLQGFGIQAF